MNPIVLQIPSGYRGGAHFTASYDSTVGMSPGYYWFAASFLLFVAIGVAKAYYDDKKWEGKVMNIISKAARKYPRDKATVVRASAKPKINEK